MRKYNKATLRVPKIIKLTPSEKQYMWVSAKGWGCQLCSSGCKKKSNFYAHMAAMSHRLASQLWVAEKLGCVDKNKTRANEVAQIAAS